MQISSTNFIFGGVLVSRMELIISVYQKYKIDAMQRLGNKLNSGTPKGLVTQPHVNPKTVFGFPIPLQLSSP